MDVFNGDVPSEKADFLGSLGPFLQNVIDGGPKWRQEN